MSIEEFLSNICQPARDEDEPFAEFRESKGSYTFLVAEELYPDKTFVLAHGEVAQSQLSGDVSALIWKTRAIAERERTRILADLVRQEC